MLRPPVFAPLTISERQIRAVSATPSLSRRLMACLYESLLIFGLVFVVALLFAVIFEQRHGLLYRHHLIATLFLAVAIYFVWFWSTQGQTLAAKTWHLQIVCLNGLLPTPMQAAFRYVLSWLWICPSLLITYLVLNNVAGVNKLFVIFGISATWLVVYSSLSLLLPQRQFLHDLLCGTRLIDTRPTDSFASA